MKPDHLDDREIIKGVFVDPRGGDCEAPHLACIIHGADLDIFELLQRLERNRRRRRARDPEPGAGLVSRSAQ